MVSSARIRRFLWQDLEQFTLLFNEVNGISNTEKAYDADFMLQFLSQPSCQPEENCFLAESGSSLVGFALIHPELPVGRAVASGGVMRSHRGRGIGRRLVKSAIQHARALDAAVLHVQALSSSADARHILDSEGFRPVRTYWQLRWEGDEVPPMGLPPGFSLRPFVLDRDEAALTQLQNAAFGDAWGFCPNTVEEISARVRLRRSEPEGIIFVLDGDRPSGYNWTMRSSNRAGSIGWIAMTGVHPDYRSRGVGRAVVVTGMEYLKAKGVDGIELEVDSSNRHATELYLDLGFKKVNEAVWYERRPE